MARPWTIIGCGYVGQRLARKLLQEGHPVTATRRTAEACEELERSVPGIVARPYTLGSATIAFPPEGVVVLSSPPGERAPGPEAAMAARLGRGTRLIYLSTTGVYASGRGAEVSDDYELSPSSERGQRRLYVERALEAVHLDYVCLRIPGIYGPGRGVHARMLRNRYRLIGDGNTTISRIHVDDLVEAILCLGRAESLPYKHYVVGDEVPTTGREHAFGVADRLGLPHPPTVALSEVSPQVRAMLTADRRVVPRRLHELGWKARYPSWREGLEQALAEEKAQGSNKS